MDETLRAAVREYLRENLRVLVNVEGDQNYECSRMYLNVSVTVELELEDEIIATTNSNTGISLG